MGLGIGEALALGAMGAGTAVSAAGSIKQGNQQAAQANYQAAMATNNANIARQNAADVVTAGKAEEQRQRIANSQQLGELRAGMGASGVDVGMGSAADASADQVMIGETNALNLRDSWIRNQNNYLQQANDLENQASMYSAAAKNAKSSGLWGAVGTLLSGAGKVGSAWAAMPESPKTDLGSKLSGTRARFNSQVQSSMNTWRP